MALMAESLPQPGATLVAGVQYSHPGGQQPIGNGLAGGYDGMGGGGGAAVSSSDTAQHVARMKQMLQHFWQTQNKEMDVLEIGTEQDFKNHNDLPLARIKRIMKSDEDVRMISAEGES